MSSESPTPATWSNLPVPIQPRFNCDQLALIFGTCITDGVFVIDCDSGSLVGANQQLLDMLEQDAQGLEETEFPFDRLVAPDDRALFHTWLTDLETDGQKSFQVRLVQASGSQVPVEVRMKTIRWQRREYRLGFVEECRERHRREARLRNELDKQKERSVKALESSLRMYELNEKIKSTLALTTRLLKVESEEELFEDAVQVLTNGEGLNFKGATFLIREGNELRTAKSTMEERPETYSLNEDNRYAELFRTGFSRSSVDSKAPGKEIVIPLRCHDEVLGLFEVGQHQREREYITGSRPLQQWQRGMLEQIGDIIAMLLDNLRLTRELERQSNIDALTEAVNRNHFMNRLIAEVQRARRYARPTSLIFLDIDFFKEINDQYGHLQGDEVLRELADVFRENLRTSDVLGRYGGDEFVVLLPETNTDMAEETATKLIESVREHHFKNLDDPAQKVPVTISVGFASLQPGQDEERFLQAADAALYEAKRLGRNRASKVS